MKFSSAASLHEWRLGDIVSFTTIVDERKSCFLILFPFFPLFFQKNHGSNKEIHGGKWTRYIKSDESVRVGARLAKSLRYG